MSLSEILYINFCHYRACPDNLTYKNFIQKQWEFSMKKTLLILSAFLCLFTSCQTKQELKPVNIKPITIEQDGAIFTSDPRFELLLIATNLAEFYPFGNSTTEYASTIQTFFKNHKTHPLIKQIKKMTKKNTVHLDYLMIFNCISEDFTSFSDQSLHNSAKKYWKKHQEKFLQNFNAFAHDTHFDKFYLAYEHKLKHQLFKAEEYFNANSSIIPTTNSILYKNNNQKYTIYCSNLSFLEAPTTIPNTIIFQADPNTKIPYTKFFTQTNFVYNSVFSLIDNNWDQLKEPITKLIKTLFEQNQITKKIEETYTIFLSSELISQYMTYHFTSNEYSEDVQKEVLEYLNKTYLFEFYPILQPMFQEYEQNPEKYANFEDFFNNYLVNKIKNISLN